MLIETIEPSGSGTQPSSAAGAGRAGPAVHALVLPSKIWVRAWLWSLETIRPSLRWAVPVSQRLPPGSFLPMPKACRRLSQAYCGAAVWKRAAMRMPPGCGGWPAISRS